VICVWARYGNHSKWHHDNENRVLGIISIRACRGHGSSLCSDLRPEPARNCSLSWPHFLVKVCFCVVSVCLSSWFEPGSQIGDVFLIARIVKISRYIRTRHRSKAWRSAFVCSVRWFRKDFRPLRIPFLRISMNWVDTILSLVLSN